MKFSNQMIFSTREQYTANIKLPCAHKMEPYWGWSLLLKSMHRLN